MPLPSDEVWNPDFREPGQSVPTPPAPLVPAMPSGAQGQYPDAPIIPAGGEHGSIDPAADRVCAWWMDQKQSDQWGPMLATQFDPNGPLYSLNQSSLQSSGRPLIMPSAALSYWTGLGLVWRFIGATLAYKLPPAGKSSGAQIGWGVAGFLMPTLTTGAVAVRQIMK